MTDETQKPTDATPAPTTSAAPDPVGQAHAEAANIIMKAEEDARAVLKEAKVWVAEKENALDTALFGWVGKKICTSSSRIGSVIDFLLGSAKSCYCCAAVRMALITAFLIFFLEGSAFLIAHFLKL